MNVKMEESAILVLSWRSVEKVDQTRIPALIGLTNPCQVERS
jgi:hypothetical protein